MESIATLTLPIAFATATVMALIMTPSVVKLVKFLRSF